MYCQHFDRYDNYEGIDASLDISLFEYGLIWGKNEHCSNDEFHFIWGIGHDGACYTTFGHGYFTKRDYNELLDEDWFDKSAIVESCGADYLTDNFPYGIYDAVMYWGSDNIFGTEYYPFHIIDFETVEYFTH